MIETTSVRHAEAVMGTVVSIAVRTPGSAEGMESTIEEVVAWLHWVDATFSTYKPESQISRLDREEMTLDECHPHVREILDLCEDLRAATGGYFDARATGRLDPSGVVKGWSIEKASALLATAGWPDHAIDGGGDIRLRSLTGSEKPWHVALRHPLRLDAFSAVVGVGDGAVATSGTYERGFHVIDPHRRRPATAVAAVTVIGPDLTTTDAYATAALAMGLEAPQWLATLADHEAFVIDAEGHGWTTPGFGRYRLDGSGGPTPDFAAGDRLGGREA